MVQAITSPNMARSKKKYSNGTTRGGTPGKATDTGFGASGNKNATKKNYARVAALAGRR